MSIPAVSVSSLCFRYDGERVLEDVNLTVERGEFLALLGPNGGGKTTLLRLILGLLSPETGTVRIFDRPPHEVRRLLGYVPQYACLRPEFPAKVLDIALMGGCRPGSAIRAWSENRQAVDKAMDILEAVGIADLAKRPISALSGGQRQRLLVARALMGREEDLPFLLILDEPTASIDPQGKFCFYEFLHGMRGEITILVVSHDIGMATPFFSQVALVNRTLRMLPEGRPTADSLRELLGSHGDDCPVTWMMGQDMAEGTKEPA